MASAQFSAQLKQKEDADKTRIEDHAKTLYGTDASQKKREENRLRNRSSKSAAEMEITIESLKRVIQKLQAENEAIKVKEVQATRKMEKLSNQKIMKQENDQLKQALHSHEMKELNFDEKDMTIRKLVEQNRSLQNDLEKERSKL